MAADDTAALVVALSAQLTKFEKDMKSAVDIADKHTKAIETRFAQLNTAVSDQLSSVASRATSQLGGFASILGAVGPVGTAVAVSLGALALAFSAVSEKVDAFAEKSKRIKEAAETAGLTITQFRLLSAAGTRVGLDFEQTEAFISRLTVAIDELRTKGSGPLFDALLRIDAGLVRQVASAKDTAEAVDIVAKAYARLTDQLQKNTLTAAVAGRRNLGAGRLLDTVAESNGLAGLQQQAEATGKVIDEKVTERIVALRREIDEIKRRTDNLYGNTFSIEVLEQQKRSAEFWERIAQATAKVAQFQATSAPSNASPFGRRFRGLDQPFVAGADQSLGGLTADRLLLEGRSRLPASQTVDVPLPPVRPAADRQSAAVELQLAQKWVAVLGEAITPAEQLKLKVLQLNAAQEAGGVSTEQTNRALAAFNATMTASLAAARERLGIATQEQITTGKLAQLSLDRTKFALSENEVERATVLILREAKDAADALAVRQAYLPGLKQLELDATNARKGLDTFATHSLNNLENSLVDVVTGTKSLSDAFRSMTNAILSDLARLVIRQTIIGPLAGALGLGGGLGGILPRFASGTDFAPGGLALVGERGPELVNLPRGSQVIPNEVARSAGGGDVNFAPVISIDARGADQGAVVRIGQAVDNLQRNLSQTIVGVMRQKQLRGVVA